MTSDAQIAYLLSEWLDAPRDCRIAAGVLIRAIRSGEDVVAHCDEIAREVADGAGEEAAYYVVSLCSRIQ